MRVLSRSLAEIPNKAIRKSPGILKLFSLAAKHDLVFDTELMIEGMPFNELSSVLRGVDNPDGVRVVPHVIDVLTQSEYTRCTGRHFQDRQAYAVDILKGFSDIITLLPQHFVYKEEDVEVFVAEAFTMGYEGAILRDPQGHYKHGRATINEGIIYKIKPDKLTDAVILAVNQATAMNEGVTRRTGFGNKSKPVLKQDDRHDVDTAGSVTIQIGNTVQSAMFGKGFDAKSRKQLWRIRHEVVGRPCEVRSMDYGEVEKLRHPRLEKIHFDRERDE